jgi:hypothetical protein
VLSYSDYTWIGFDADFTLIPFNRAEMEPIVFTCVLKIVRDEGAKTRDRLLRMARESKKSSKAEPGKGGKGGTSGKHGKHGKSSSSGSFGSNCGGELRPLPEDWTAEVDPATPYPLRFAVKGGVVDAHLGNVVKVDFLHRVRDGYHGDTRLSVDEIRGMYVGVCVCLCVCALVVIPRGM